MARLKPSKSRRETLKAFNATMRELRKADAMLVEKEKADKEDRPFNLRIEIKTDAREYSKMHNFKIGITPAEYETIFRTIFRSRIRKNVEPYVQNGMIEMSPEEKALYEKYK